jgi:hypothetical protein
VRFAVKSCSKQLFDSAFFNDLAQVHHADPVGHVRNYAQIVGDQQVGETQFVLKPEQKIHDLRSYRYIQRGYGFVENEEFWFRSECPSDGYSLSLPSTQLVWVMAGEGRWESHEIKEFSNPSCSGRTTSDFLGGQRVGDDASDFPPGIQ